MTPSGPPDVVSVDDELGKDHERIGTMIAGLAEAIRSRSAEASGFFQPIDRLLRRHMTWEEEFLFPAVWARATAAQRRSIESLEIDHERIDDALKSLASALASGAWEECRGLIDQLDIFLRGHNYDEEHGVYVEADRLLEPGERRRLLERFGPGAAETGSGAIRLPPAP